MYPPVGKETTKNMQMSMSACRRQLAGASFLGPVGSRPGHGHSLHCCCKAALAQCLGQSPAPALPGEALPMKLGLISSLSTHPDNTQKLRSLVISLTS